MSEDEPLPTHVAKFQGVLLRNRYRVEQKVGQGGMATIFAATDTELGRKVVVKVPHLNFVDRHQFRERFELEVKGLVDTEHPHVVSILARGDHDGVPYFVIQFLRGGSLEDRIKDNPIAPKPVAAWLNHIADALDFIHAKRIVHRDVKPGNILFDEANNVFLSDFGVAKAMGQDTSLTADGFTVGSPEYMAPEQIANVDIGPWTDQYALGVTVYECLSRVLPITGNTPLELLMGKASKDPKPLSEHGLPQAISDAVMRTLCRAPKERYASCREFAAAFEAAVLEQEPHGTPGGRLSATPARHTIGGSLDLTGLTLLGHYQVTGRLGSGGMGTVYLAVDTDLGKNVVIKIPHPRLVAERGFLERFNREITQLLRLEHPSIVRVLARGDVDSFPFYVLQHMKGGSLSDRIKAAKDLRMSNEDVLSWFDATARALDFLHSRQLIHRDVKPGNILFDEHDHAYLSDFGIAKATEEEDANLTTTNTGVGSPRYMAPEQAGDKFEGRADQYALATTVYEAITGRLPFPDGTALEIMIKKMQELPPAPSQFVPSLPLAASDALLRALAGNPDHRFPTCRAFFLAFKRALRGEGDPAPPPQAVAPPAAPPVATPIAPAPVAASRTRGTLRAPQAAAPVTPVPRVSAGQGRGARGGAPSTAAVSRVQRTRRASREVRLWRPAFVLAFAGIWLLARFAPFARFVFPHQQTFDLTPDLLTMAWALVPPALVIGIGHGWLLHTKGVTRAWAWAPATLIGAAVAGAMLVAAVDVLGDSVHIHPLGAIAGACLGVAIGVCQWLALSPDLHLPWRWWVVTAVALAVAGGVSELSQGNADTVFALVAGSGLLVALLQLAALRSMAPASVDRSAQA